VAIALSGALTACSGGGSSTGEGATLTYWATNMAPTLQDDERILRPELDRFEEETGIAVELEVVPWDSLYNRILTAVSSGEGPDVLNIGNTWSASLQATGAFVPFEGEALEAIGGTDRFVPTAMAATGAEGETPAAVPLLGQSYAVFYNERLFADAGVTPPAAGWTWQQFVDAAGALTRDTDGDGSIDQYGLGLTGASIANGSHAAFIFGKQHGGELFDDAGEPQFDNDRTVAAVTDFVGLMGAEGVVLPGSAEYTTDAQVADDLMAGTVAMALQQSGNRSTYAQAGFEDYGVVQVPVLDPLPEGGEPVQTMVAGINISVFTDSDQQDGALQLVEFLTGEEQQVTLNKAYGTLPVVTAAYEDPAFSDPVSGTFATILGDFAAPMPQVPEEGQMETLVGGAVKDLLARAAVGEQVGEAEVRAALQSADEQMAAAGN
jgi:multiple sugar transport system substrate-binding protein